MNLEFKILMIAHAYQNRMFATPILLKIYQRVI